jgi:hypothetical protein
MIANHAGRRHISLFEASLMPDCRAALKPRAAESLRLFSDLIIETGDRGERSNPIEAIDDFAPA